MEEKGYSIIRPCLGGEKTTKSQAKIVRGTIGPFVSYPSTSGEPKRKRERSKQNELSIDKITRKGNEKCSRKIVWSLESLPPLPKIEGDPFTRDDLRKLDWKNRRKGETASRFLGSEKNKSYKYSLTVLNNNRGKTRGEGPKSTGGGGNPRIKKWTTKADMPPTSGGEERCENTESK